MTAIRRVDARDDTGQLTVLILGYTAIAVVLVIIGVDASTAFLDRRALAAAADDAAVAAAGAVNTSVIYREGLTCGQPLPIDPAAAGIAAMQSVASDVDLRRAFNQVDAPQTSVDGPTASVALAARTRLPLQGVIALVDPAVADGITIRATSSARSPTVLPGGC